MCLRAGWAHCKIHGAFCKTFLSCGYGALPHAGEFQTGSFTSRKRYIGKSSIVPHRGTREPVMNVYDRWVLPPILDLAMRTSRLQKYRREVVAAAQGRVLEIGVGSGLNLPLYGRQAELVIGIDPSPRLLAMARRRAAEAGVRAALLQASAAAIPLADRTVDTVVMTWTLCSIPDPLGHCARCSACSSRTANCSLWSMDFRPSHGWNAGSIDSRRFGAMSPAAVTLTGRWTISFGWPASI
jgi:SAM-dependent methyltransferase